MNGNTTDMEETKMSETAKWDIVVNSTTLATTFKNALIFARKDTGRPVLASVSLKWAEGLLTVVATDSYRLLVQEVRQGIEDSTGSMLLDRTDVEQFVKMVGKASGFVRLRHADDGSVAVELVGGWSMTVKPKTENYPNWRILADWEPIAPDAAGIASSLNGKFLADLGKVRTVDGARNPPVRLITKGLKAARFDFGGQNGNRIYGAIMPIRGS